MPGLIDNAYTAVFGAPKPVATPQIVVAAPPPPPEVKPPPPPLEKLKGTWDTPVVPKVDPANIPVNFLDNINVESVNKAAKTVDFKAAITPEVMAAVAKGGTEGVQAMLDAMNDMSRDGYGKSALATAQIVKKALADQKADFLKELPKIIRDQTIKGSAKKANPLFDDPALKPISTALETSFAAQHPNASADEISEMVKDYFTTISSVLAPSATPTKNRKTKDGTDDIDWEEFASKDS